MKIEDFAQEVAVAQVDFQGEVQVWGSLPSGVMSYLRTEAFPLSAPPSLRSARDYGGLKIFSYQSRLICIAYFYDAGKTDEFNRAIPSAVVLVFDRSLYKEGFRNLPAIRDFLMDVARNPSGESEVIRILHSIYTEAVITNDQDLFHDFFLDMKVDTDILQKAHGLLSGNRQLQIFSQDMAIGQGFFAALFATVPTELLESSAWCTYVHSISGQYEQVVVLMGQLPVEKEQSWLNQVKTRLTGEKSVEAGVDLSRRVVQGPQRKTTNRRVAEQLFSALLNNELQLSLAFSERFVLFLALLGACCREAPVTVSSLPPGLVVPETEKRLEAYLKKVLRD